MTGDSIVFNFPSVQVLVEGCGGNEGNILSRELDNKMRCHRSAMMAEFQKIQNLQLQHNEDLKKIVAEHCSLSEIYKHIIQKAKIQDEELINLMKEKIVVDIEDHHICELYFVKSLEPHGHLSNFIVDALCHIWNQEWNNKKMFSQCAVVSTS